MRCPSRQGRQSLPLEEEVGPICPQEIGAHRPLSVTRPPLQVGGDAVSHLVPLVRRRKIAAVTLVPGAEAGGDPLRWKEVSPLAPIDQGGQSLLIRVSLPALSAMKNVAVTLAPGAEAGGDPLRWKEVSPPAPIDQGGQLLLIRVSLPVLSAIVEKSRKDSMEEALGA